MEKKGRNAFYDVYLLIDAYQEHSKFKMLKHFLALDEEATSTKTLKGEAWNII